jgi:site-specific DNA-methyltransferase (adenine-specific)
MSARPRATSTSRFGVGRRESHDASDFYSRFRPPELSDDDAVHPNFDLTLDEAIVTRDAREVSLPAGSVALVVTSPPYFAGKAYEEALGRDGIPGSYLEYLQMLRDVFARCVEMLEPGGRIAVNVANLGRRPYRSLSADVIGILQDDLGLLLRGEVIWAKAEGASGSCAWGSFRSAVNPVLRDVTERVIVASKGRFDRARAVEARKAEGLPWRSWVSNDEFMEATLDFWRIAPESARRVNHPAPFPVELPLRLIDLYTYEDDLVFDPFLGSGSTAVAAVRRRRRFAGCDTDGAYVDMARARVARELELRDGRRRGSLSDPPAAAAAPGDAGDDVQSRATRAGKAAGALAEQVLVEAGFTIEERNHRVPGLGIAVSIMALDGRGERWYLDVTGAFTTTPAGLIRTDTLWKCLGRCALLAKQGIRPVVLLTSHLPPRRSNGDRALRAAGHDIVFDAIEILSPADHERLGAYAQGGHRDLPSPGFWADADLGLPPSAAPNRAAMSSELL